MGRILNAPARRRAGPAASLATIAVLLAGCGAAGQQTSGMYGTFALKAGETREVQTGYIYQNMRVCNDAESAGLISATIDDHITHQLQPGVCAEDLGNSVLVVNHGNGPAYGTYRPIYDFAFQTR
jgi:hypothetical protein